MTLTSTPGKFADLTVFGTEGTLFRTGTLHVPTHLFLSRPTEITDLGQSRTCSLLTMSGRDSEQPYWTVVFSCKSQSKSTFYKN